MADPKLLTENNWKTVSLKLKVKHNDLQKALADFDKLQDHDHDELLQCIGEIKKHALALKKSKEAAANAPLVKHLADMLSAAEAEQRDVAKAKADAEKQNVTHKKVEDAASKKGVGGGDDDEADDEDGEYAEQLLAALQKLKGARDVSYEFIVCEGKPHPCVMVAKKITPKHKEQLSKAAGSKRFLHVGTCRVDEGKFNFSMEKPVTGLAHKLQESIKHHTGKKFPICVGTESVDAQENGQPSGMPATADAPLDGPKLTGIDPALQGPGAPPKLQESKLNLTAPFSISASVGRGGKNNPADVEIVQAALNKKAKAGLNTDGKCGPKTIAAIEAFQKQLGQHKPDGRIDPGRGTARALASSGPLAPPATPPQPVAPPKLGKPELAKAPGVWHGLRKIVDTNIGELKKAVRGHFAHEHPEVLKAIDGGLGKLDSILDNLDHKLADSLAQAHAAANDAARKAELQKSKIILASYIKYVKSEPLIAQIDENPFGVATNLKRILTDNLTHMAQSIG